MTPQPCIFSPSVSFRKCQSTLAYLNDLAVCFPCTDGQTEYPSLTETSKGNNATIFSASSSDTYPGGQAFPRFDGVNDYATAGNVTEANITDNLVVCMWFRELLNVGGSNVFCGKWISGSHQQFLLYRYGTSYRFIVSSTGSNFSIVSHAQGTVVRTHDLFMCGVYQYKTSGTSEMRLFMNAADSGTLTQVGTISNAIGPLYTSSSAPLAMAASYNGSTYAGFSNIDMKRVEIYNVDASRIGDWLDGTNPQLRFEAGSGQ